MKLRTNNLTIEQTAALLAEVGYSLLPFSYGGGFDLGTMTMRYAIRRPNGETSIVTVGQLIEIVKGHYQAAN